ncbi:MAG TPA: SUMF1/EgtB/PvdO family nonheme iron enzyme, partial [Puia sp.]|nr:SUMF1/EgtB/PvdO family nonheme iron enzyme [Puia sp.]
MPPTRQLAAIMFADIMGFTAMMQEDESLAMRLREKLKTKIESEIILHKGKVIKFSGDGVLCSFDSASESVRAAIAVQLSMQEDIKVPLRIGIHQADVIFEEADVHGDGVNIASRLESLAVPGSIFISAKVYDDIKNQKDIQATSLGKYVLKNVKEPVEIFAISNEGLQVPLKKKLEGKAIKYVEYSKSSKGLLIKYTKLALVVLILGIAAFFLINPWMKKQNARAELIPAIQKLVNDNFRPPTQAFDLIMQAKKYIPNDSALIKLLPVVTKEVSLETEPEGAEVFWKDYNKPESEWRSAGITPLKNVPFPRSYLRLEIRKKGYQTIEYAAPGQFAVVNPYINLLKLDPIGSLPENMVRVPKRKTGMNIIGLEKYGPKEVGEFLIDKYEVTNAKFKSFIDAGGYTNKTFWKYPIYSNGGEIISLESALALFVDKTGRPGPANWEAGTYPDGQGDFPVTGVCWYEAEAYAAFAGKQLPTVFHWSVIAETSRTEFIVPLSNFNGKASTKVGSMPGYNTFGIYDVAGNAREWCYNQSANFNQRYILGGGWNDPSYSFNDGYTQNAIDRGLANGFRCMKELPGDTSAEHFTIPLITEFRDYTKEKPVDDKTFDIILRQYAYDKTPLNAHVDSIIQNESWTCEKISFDAAYNNERMIAYLYLPKTGKPPFQTVLFFGGSGDIFSKKFDVTNGLWGIDFLVKSGRAVVCPIYKGTNERHDGLNSDEPDESVLYKDHVIMWRKDIGRTIDYLETRNDIDAKKIGFLGWSWGGFLGGIMPAVEKRFKAVVLNVGGMDMGKSLPEADQINFLPRVTEPILMLNGEHDMFFPEKTSQQ